MKSSCKRPFGIAAQTIERTGNYAVMPILADALEDAGCDCDALLDHCRQDGPHMRGCWAIDIIRHEEEFRRKEYDRK